MQAASTPVLRDIVLIGGGHSHVVVLKSFGMRPVPGVRLTVICRDTDTPYSGMLPGYIAGHYGFDDVHIDLRRLAQYAGARFIRASVTGLDRANRRVLLAGRPDIAYDIASINIGATPRLGTIAGAETHGVAVKPIFEFNQHWLSLLERVRARTGPLEIAVVGAGAAGVEMVLAMHHRLRAERSAAGTDPDKLRFHLLGGDADILPTHNARVRATFRRLLASRGVILHLGSPVVAAQPGRVRTERGETVAVDELVWVTRAGGAAWLAGTGLALDEDGFVRVGPTLQSVTDPAVFAAGDVASMDGTRLEKAGVFAVRMGAPLAENLRLAVAGRAPEYYRPQRRWLALISTGDKGAVASRGLFSASGASVWRWKDWIDRRFMRRFTELEPMPVGARAPASDSSDVKLEGEEAAQAISAIAMRCGGCGAKVGATVLSRALGRLQPVQRDDVLIGLDAPDDAAVVRVPPGRAMVHTIDFFRAFVDDPYLFGRIAAHHALGDIYAMGAEPQSATSVVTVPPGLEAKVEETLFQLMSGAVDVLNEAGCALIGGHTGEGAELALGFAINGLIDERLVGITRKGGLKPGDALILTKPIGTGTLFAALPRLAVRGRWIDAALTSMNTSNAEGARILATHDASASTDLTGFGLIGHLVEMTRPSGVDARLVLSALPVLPGAEETAAAGILSSLSPANVRLRRAIANQEAMVDHPRYRLLFDPQTAGGLLAGVPAARAADCVAALRAAGYAHTIVIGEVLPQGDALAPITLMA